MRAEMLRQSISTAGKKMRLRRLLSAVFGKRQENCCESPTSSAERVDRHLLLGVVQRRGERERWGDAIVHNDHSARRRRTAGEI